MTTTLGLECFPATQGLAYLAEQKVIHGDLKPANLLIGGDRRVKLADFGSAMTWSEASASWEGPLNGTPAFRAPETLAQPAALSTQVRCRVCVQWSHEDLVSKFCRPSDHDDCLSSARFDLFPRAMSTWQRLGLG
jgi:serine/threonine protein kinase